MEPSQAKVRDLLLGLEGAQLVLTGSLLVDLLYPDPGFLSLGDLAHILKYR